MNGLADSLYLQGLLQRNYVTDREIRRCLQLQDEAYRAGRRDTSLLDFLIEEGFISASQGQRIVHDLEEGKEFNLHVPGYRIVGKVGEGGMGVVYRARQSSLQRDVALKVLRADLSADGNFLERFRREAVCTAQINHPHVVGVVDVGMIERDRRWYIVMELIEGIDLSVELAQRGRFEEMETARIGLEVARALAHLHRLGYIHRDVKPQNIMITKDRIAKLTDMGLARQIHDEVMIKKEAGKALGTPDYISPEAIRGEGAALDGRADQYSLGATLFHIVTGRVPFVAENPVKVMGKHMDEPLTPAAKIRTDLKLGLSEVIEVLMGKRRSDRYPTTEDLVRDMEAIVSGRPPVFALQKLGRPVPPMPDPLPEPDEDDDDEPSAGKPTPAPAGTPAWVWLAVGVSALANLGLAALLLTAQ
jgi:serine/threonine-protein kinase